VASIRRQCRGDPKVEEPQAPRTRRRTRRVGWTIGRGHPLHSRVVSSLSEVQDEALVENKFGAFLASQNTSGGTTAQRASEKVLLAFFLLFPDNNITVKGLGPRLLNRTHPNIGGLGPLGPQN